jgi:hypothetical protein
MVDLRVAFIGKELRGAIQWKYPPWRKLCEDSGCFFIALEEQGDPRSTGATMPKDTHTRAAEHYENAAKNLIEPRLSITRRVSTIKGHDESKRAHEHSTQAHRHSTDAHGKSEQARTKK